ncbi:hypothetical protein [Spongiimicrobium salis]|uniref:hypothetical protein n=1 Tax=Spongiimicrobium salis TaxID=1667022 RepID=UPI00374DB2F3
MEKMMHFAAQYLAMAGASFVAKKEDDSHTNLGFSVEEKKMFSRPLDTNGSVLLLDYAQFALEWRNPNGSTVLALDNTSHADILQWIRECVEKSEIENSYSYAPHYELPYTITDDFVFKLIDKDRLQALTQLRILAHSVLSSFLTEHRLDSEIRIWPHHFDTGAFVFLADGSDRSIGLGLSVPDSMINDHYFYISGYRGHDGLDTSTFSELTKGSWHNSSFKGATLAATGIDHHTAVTFLTEALTAYKK